MNKTSIILLAIFLMGFLGIGVASAQPQTLDECIKIRANFKLNIQTAASAISEVVFTPGAIVAMSTIAADSGTCSKTASAIDKVCTTANAGATGLCYTFKSSEYGAVAMLNTIYTVTNWVFFIMTIVAVLMIIFGGFTYITAAGDPAKAGKGKTILTYAIIGLAIALIAKIIPSLVRFILGM